MSGLYNLVFGENSTGRDLVVLLNGVQPVAVGRYRDAWVEADGDSLLIRVHTRNGGGNRDDYGPEIGSMQSHPWYVRDEDDDFDSTYADFYFRPDPAQVEPNVARWLVSQAVEHVDMGERWEAVIEAIHDGGAS